ncbi:protein kinase domain-containing protein [Knoellia koreensis]|uniref:protein kinase domain-containing protein n=1 Tax=Knoellia koreensis TaxID=2730921 RepID=UPI00197F1FF7
MGEVFAGRYELVDLIGEGGMGSVWRVWDSREQRLVAAKVLRQSDAVSLLRFVREQAMRVRHRHVLTPVGWAGEDDRVLFTMPVVEGGSVATLVGDFGALPPLFVAEVLRQLTEAVGAVHEAGVLHRDVKPANVLLAATGTDRPYVLLTDFGIAIDMEGPRLTQTGVWSGTPGYAAPETLRGAEPHPTADLYAVGQVGLTMLTGERPGRWEGRPSGIPDALWQLVIELADDDPAKRPQDAAEVRGRLDDPSLTWTPEAIGDVEVLRHVPQPPAGTSQLTAAPPEDEVTVAPQPSPGQPQAATLGAAGATSDDATTRRRPVATPAVDDQSGDHGGGAREASAGSASVPDSARGQGLGPIVAAAVATVAVVVGVLVWSPWSGDETPARTPNPSTPVAPSTTTSSASNPSTTSGSPTTTTPLTTTPRGSVGVGTVVTRVGQTCEFSDVGVRETTTDGVPVVCTRNDDGRYTWVRR